ncbi:rRNA maturation RNase YbeY [Candidatus Auribacterota bacterium]
MEIQINNRQRLVKLNQESIRTIVRTILKTETKKKYSDNFEISLNFVRDKAIQEINKKYLGKDSPTDVISFSMIEGELSSLYPDILGDVFISSETAIRQAQEYKFDLNSEMILYIVHGVLHLLKYDDIDPQKRKIMKRKERYYLKKFKLLKLIKV